VVIRPRTLYTKLCAVVLSSLALVQPVSGQAPPQLPAPAASATVTNAPAPATDPRGIADVAIATGVQVSKARLDQVLSERDVRVAVAFFEQRQIRLDRENAADGRFRRLRTNEVVAVTFLSFIDRTSAATPAVQHVVSVAHSARAAKVSVGSIAVEGKEPVVREDSAVADGKVVPNAGFLKAFIKCSVPSCGAAAAGCWVGGPGALPCFCAWCGVGAVLCAALELALP